MAIITLDFTGAPPAQGGGTDRIPAGKYLLRLERFEDTKTKNGNRAIRTAFTVRGGEFDGSRLSDMFVIEGGKDGKVSFGLSRLHAFMLALGLPVGERRFQLDSDRLVGLTCIGDVIDGTIPATAEYDERPVSKIDAYYQNTGAQAQPAAVSTPPAPPPAPAPAPAAAPVVVPPGPAGAAVDALPVDVPLTTPAPAPDAVDVAASAVDDLFGA